MKGEGGGKARDFAFFYALLLFDFVQLSFSPYTFYTVKKGKRKKENTVK
jgi:hypothetical protein